VSGDALENVKRNCSVKKQSMERQRQTMEDTEKEMSSKLQQIDASQAELKVGNSQDTCLNIQLIWLCILVYTCIEGSPWTPFY